MASARVAPFPSSTEFQLQAFGARGAGALRVEKELGAGLQGRVLLAFDEAERQHVAVKLPSVFGGDKPVVDADALEYQMRTLMHERNALRRVAHPNVTRYLRALAGRCGKHEYTAMVTEYAPNGDLFDIMAETGALSAAMAKAYFLQLLRALEACHASGVVHRDVKLENILLDEEFNLKLCDFGLAVAARWGDSAEDVMVRGESGTAMYMAPEVHSKRPYRAAPVDAWSAGVVLFILLTGVPPFDKAAKGDYWYDALLQGDLARFWSAQQTPAGGLDEAAKDLISRVLSADPEQRLTVEQALRHPWMSDAADVDMGAVAREMAARRKQAQLAAPELN